MNILTLTVLVLVCAVAVNAQFGQFGGGAGVASNTAIAANTQDVNQKASELSAADRKALRLEKKRQRRARKAARKARREARRLAREQALNAASQTQFAQSNNLDAGAQKESANSLKLALSIDNADREGAYIKKSDNVAFNNQELLQAKDNYLEEAQLEEEAQEQSDYEALDGLGFNAEEQAQLAARDAINQQNAQQVQAQDAFQGQQRAAGGQGFQFGNPFNFNGKRR